MLEGRGPGIWGKALTLEVLLNPAWGGKAEGQEGLDLARSDLGEERKLIRLIAF